MTNNPKGDLPVHDVGEVYDMIIWNNPVGYYSIVVEYENLNDHYVERLSLIHI